MVYGPSQFHTAVGLNSCLQILREVHHVRLQDVRFYGGVLTLAVLQVGPNHNVLPRVVSRQGGNVYQLGRQALAVSRSSQGIGIENRCRLYRFCLNGIGEHDTV